jgi:hypothetical protein
MKQMRDKITFHYDPTLASKVLTAMTFSHPVQPTTVRMGEKALDWYFEAADLTTDRVVTRQIFNIPQSANIRIEVDKIVYKLQEIASAFGDFAGYFIQYHTGR